METGRETYTASRWRPAIQPRSASSGVAIAADLLNAGDAHAVGAARGLDRDLVPDLVADERLPHRRLEADAAGFRVRLGRADDPVGLLVVAAVLGEADCAAHPDDALLRRRLLDDDVVLDDRLELPYARLHHSLLVLGGVVLEVLGEIAQLAGGFDLGDDRRPA